MNNQAEDMILKFAEAARTDLSQSTSAHQKAEMGQFLTPTSVACMIASLVEELPEKTISILDPGAGAGSLSATLVLRILSSKKRPDAVHLTAFEIDPKYAEKLTKTLIMLKERCEKLGVAFSTTLRTEDFIEAYANSEKTLFEKPLQTFDYVIMNPPYRKINSTSQTRKQLSEVGIETSNLYTAFMLIGARLLRQHGQFVSITPRSFCNGPYFKPFRDEFFRLITINRIHVFESRSEAFQEDDVLQENIILAATRSGESAPIQISTNDKTGKIISRSVAYEKVISPTDTDSFLHILPHKSDELILRKMSKFSHSLAELGLAVSTGRVVDFRAREWLRHTPNEKNTVPLIYSINFKDHSVQWPVINRKACAIVDSKETSNLMVPKGTYVLTKRFSTKEERKRIVAAVYNPKHINAELVGFENHLNYYHNNGMGLDPLLARGLMVYLNSTLVDQYFRQFNGHTQVNATDLRKITYPSRERLMQFGELALGALTQDEIDLIVERVTSLPQETASKDPRKSKSKSLEQCS